MLQIKKEVTAEHLHPLPSEPVRFKETGVVSEVMFMTSCNHSCKVQKLDADNYVLLETGEVKQFEHIENRSQDLNSVRASLGRLRDYLNTNVTDVTRCRWVTLTYAENMTDTKRLYSDFKKFNMRLRYLIGHYEYIVAYEPQERGAWHMHMVMLFKGKAPYISNEEMSDAWGFGFVTVKKLEQVDNVGAYLTAYLADMEVSEDDYDPFDSRLKTVHYDDENGEPQTKRYIKGARLCMYPSGFNLYSCSRGVKKPVITKMNAETAEKKVSAATLTFERTLKLSDDTGFVKAINYRYYNSIRAKEQEGI